MTHLGNSPQSIPYATPVMDWLLDCNSRDRAMTVRLARILGLALILLGLGICGGLWIQFSAVPLRRVQPEVFLGIFFILCIPLISGIVFLACAMAAKAGGRASVITLLVLNCILAPLFLLLVIISFIGIWIATDFTEPLIIALTFSILCFASSHILYYSIRVLMYRGTRGGNKDLVTHAAIILAPQWIICRAKPLLLAGGSITLLCCLILGGLTIRWTILARTPVPFTLAAPIAPILNILKYSPPTLSWSVSIGKIVDSATLVSGRNTCGADIPANWRPGFIWTGNIHRELIQFNCQPKVILNGHEVPVVMPSIEQYIRSGTSAWAIDLSNDLNAREMTSVTIVGCRPPVDPRQLAPWSGDFYVINEGLPIAERRVVINVLRKQFPPAAKFKRELDAILREYGAIILSKAQHPFTETNVEKYIGKATRMSFANKVKYIASNMPNLDYRNKDEFARGYTYNVTESYMIKFDAGALFFAAMDGPLIKPSSQAENSPIPTDLVLEALINLDKGDLICRYQYYQGRELTGNIYPTPEHHIGMVFMQEWIDGIQRRCPIRLTCAQVEYLQTQMLDSSSEGWKPGSFKHISQSPDGTVIITLSSNCFPNFPYAGRVERESHTNRIWITPAAEILTISPQERDRGNMEAAQALEQQAKDTYRQQVVHYEEELRHYESKKKVLSQKRFFPIPSSLVGSYIFAYLIGSLLCLWQLISNLRNNPPDHGRPALFQLITNLILATVSISLFIVYQSFITIPAGLFLNPLFLLSLFLIFPLLIITTFWYPLAIALLKHPSPSS